MSAVAVGVSNHQGVAVRKQELGILIAHVVDQANVVSVVGVELVPREALDERTGFDLPAVLPGQGLGPGHELLGGFEIAPHGGNTVGAISFVLLVLGRALGPIELVVNSSGCVGNTLAVGSAHYRTPPSRASTARSAEPSSLI